MVPTKFFHDRVEMRRRRGAELLQREHSHLRCDAQQLTQRPPMKLEVELPAVEENQMRDEGEIMRSSPSGRSGSAPMT